MSNHWWELTTPAGLPRFYLFTSPYPRHKYLHVNVVELKPDAVDLPRGYRSKETQRTLLRTAPLYFGKKGSKGNRVLDRAERVLRKLNQMQLSLMAVEQEKGGIQKLFDQLWLEDVEQYDAVYPPTVGEILNRR